MSSIKCIHFEHITLNSTMRKMTCDICWVQRRIVRKRGFSKVTTTTMMMMVTIITMILLFLYTVSMFPHISLHKVLILFFFSILRCRSILCCQFPFHSSCYFSHSRISRSSVFSSSRRTPFQNSSIHQLFVCDYASSTLYTLFRLENILLRSLYQKNNNNIKQR